MFLTVQLWLAGAAGIISHLGFFIRGEHHLQAPKTFRLYVILAGFIFLTNTYCILDVKIGAKSTCLVVSSYGVALFCSMLVYRTVFHPLRRFSGPFMAKTTKLWNVIQALDSDNFRLMENLHQRYGDFVRTGPNEISIFRPEAVRALDGVGSKCSKAAWYDIMQPRVSVATTRDKELHSRRRKIWEKAFTTQALQEYEGRLIYFSKQLQKRILESESIAVNVSSLFYLYSFDVMSDLAFGKPLNMLESDEYHFTVGLLQDGMRFLGPLSPVPWLVRVGYSIPGLAQNFKGLLAWSAQKLKDRLEDEPTKRDIMSWILDASRQAGTMKQDQHWLQGDCFAIIVAGTDTVASTLISIFYHLAADQKQMQKLRTELQGIDSITDMRALQSMGHLNGCINEALRLHPAIPSGGFRVTPPEGLTIAGQYIPGDVVVSAPKYSIGRLESCYEQAQDFVPERWYSKPEMIKDKSGFSPFSMGRHNCIGKNLALMQIRSVVASLVTQFDISFAPHEDGVAVWRDSKDQFNAHPGKLDLVFSARKR